MKLFAISGTWHTKNKKVKKDVEETTKKIIKEGNGIINGGALGVDYFATEIVLKFGDPKKQLKICLPIKLEEMCKHYFRRAKEGVITNQQAKKITTQLKKVAKASPDSILDKTHYLKANKKSYFARNNTIVGLSNALYAFQVNESEGVQDAINKAKTLGKPVHVKKYCLPKEKTLLQ